MHLRLGLLGDVVGERLAVGLHLFERGAVQQSDGHAGFLGNLRLPFVLLFLRLVSGVLGFKLLDAFGGLFGFGQLGAGYTLVYHSRGLQLVQYEPFESTQKAIEEGLDLSLIHI